MDLGIVKNIGIDYLMKTPVGESINNAFLEFEKCQRALSTLINNEDGTNAQTLRIGTIFALSVVNKMVSGKQPKDFTNDEWKEIADASLEYGIMMEGDKYSLFVFDMYAKYLALSVEINNERIDKECAKEVYGLIDELNFLGQQFQQGDITEPDYVDRCLWLCLEALVKLMAAYKTSFIPSEYALLIRAISDYAVSYARIKMYTKEKELLDEYIESQYLLDQELEQKYHDFSVELQKETEKFNQLVENAFSSDFREILHSSVSLAIIAGVPQEEILDSIEKVDEYFM